MNKSIYIFYLLAFVALTNVGVYAGNPDRQGEGGAPELLMNPWARSSGLHTMTTSMISGVEAMRLNVAGLARLNKTEVVLSNTTYLKGTGIHFNAAGLAQKIGKNSALGLSIMAIDFGDIPVTTTLQPEGTGSTFSPRFFNLGLGFSHIFVNKVSVGVLVRAVSEAIQDASASTVALDAGVQYVTGEKDNFKFGISLRNIGGRMQFRGEGLSSEVPFPGFDGDYGGTGNQRTSSFELQSVLNIGLSYDFYAAENHRITPVANYTSNAFSEDQIGGGIEYAFRELVMIRGGYKADFGQFSSDDTKEPLYTGIAAGVTLNVPVSKKANAPRIAIDYAYLSTKVYDGSHTISVRINI
ncbi:MAG: PorV/PorQ family protein [Lewinellaceae bacterium]|nr:PorV/PorQ family protein [Saprospiraceae bacterium]MCB9340314.1 PorV/PorQ family protein [Lewinellaceae bacterium]